MKILFNTYSMAFQKPGGGEIIIEKLAESLKKQGIEVDFHDIFSTKLKDYDLTHHFSTLDWHCWHTYHNENTPFILTPTMWPDISINSLIKGKLKRALSILTNTSQHTLKNYLNFPEFICPTTQLESDRISKVYKVDPKKLVVIPNGVSSPCDECFSKLHKGDYYLFVGNLSPIKNIKLLIDIFSKNQKELRIVGASKGYELPQNLPNNIKYLGSMESESHELHTLYVNAKATIVPSFFETCSLVALESLSYNTPVIITKNGGTKEVFANQVQYFDPYQPDSLTEAIHSIETNKKQSNYKNFIQEYYNWDNIAKKYIELYSKTIQQKRNNHV